MHDTVTVGIPVVAILFGILFNQRGLDKLEGRVGLQVRPAGEPHGHDAG